MGGRSQKSDIFIKHFDKVTLPSGDLQAICKYCSKAYKWQHGGGYGTLIRHIEKNHPVEIGISRSQSQIPTFSSQSGNESQLFKFSESDFRDETARFVAVEQLSFSFGDKLSFQNWLSSSANPAIRRIPRNTLKRTIHKLVATQKKELIKEFSSLDNKVSLCSDIWSDSYMRITCHWIDSAWNIQKRLLAYRCFNDPHTAQNISHLMFLILEEYGLTSKIFSISFDNASANTCSIDELIRICQPSIGGKFFHIRCTCHIFNEKYFLNIPEIFLCAIVLDPRLKLDSLGELLTLYYDSLNPITDTCPSSSMIISSVRHSLTEIYTEYNEKYGSQVPAQTQHTTSSIITSLLTKAQNLIRDRTKRPRGSSSSNLELENYLTTTFDFSTTDDEDTFDILRWWTQKKQVYPILSLMKKEILACPVSTVAVEQAFSMGGYTLDERRSTIRPENLESQCLLNDWSRAASRTQDQDETNDDEDTEGTSGTTTGGGGTSECD
ncbi:hypothetical protein F511_07449 [Dorcoceras hygrometricum]|uniref:BED-type domain-containing protein n=1 Tax=Dorcoceras hygrometricum TaxID=472368 RepID=A0A2Z7C7L3_9LAMI|nr:hypothetical protein F511_07449 [Dorcoceras hygrometricum]